MEPTREIFWNVGNANLAVYVLSLIAVIILILGIRKRVKLWSLGQPEKRNDQVWKRIKSVLWFGLGHGRTFKELYPGIFHFILFWGFVILLLGTTLIFLQEDVFSPIFHYFFLQGHFYLWFSLILDLFGGLAIIGVLLALYRRYVIKPEGLDNLLDDAATLILLLVILVTGFLVEGFRIASDFPEFERWSVFGWATAMSIDSVGLAGAPSLVWHRILWWIHFAFATIFIVYIAYSKLLHILASSLTQFFRSLTPRGALKPIPDMENQETFGVSRVEEFTWRQLLDADGCTRCGRCQDNCPAYLTEKPLSPKKIIQDLKSNLGQTSGSRPALIGESIAEDELWACTTCFACQEACPVFVEQVGTIVDMRRHLVLMEAKFPQEVTQVFRNMETNYNPWAIGFATRADWAKDLAVKTLAEGKKVDLLYWVGCAGSFDDRNKKVSRAVVKILQTAGVSFGILGTEEYCCGETARRIGNEYLAQILIEKNIETLKKYEVKRILTTCPHGYNTFKNEYPLFGAEFEMIHHTEFIRDLIKNGKLRIKKEIKEKLVYHDSCYLGRYNDIYDSPREVIGEIAKEEILEMERRKNKGFCCGAGGGRMWMEETLGKRINQMRVQQAKESGAGSIITACPYCLTMLSDGIKEINLEESMNALDLAEVVEMALD